LHAIPRAPWRIALLSRAPPPPLPIRPTGSAVNVARSRCHAPMSRRVTATPFAQCGPPLTLVNLHPARSAHDRQHCKEM
jgi:hypothetical protein